MVDYIRTLGVFVLAQNTQPFNFHIPKQQQDEHFTGVFKTMETRFYPFRVLTDSEGNAVFVIANTNLDEMKRLAGRLLIHTFLFTDKVESEANKNDTFKIYSLNKDYYRNEVNTLYNKATELYKKNIKVDYEGEHIKEICFTDEWIYPNFMCFNFGLYDKSKYEDADKTVKVNVSSLKDRINKVYQTLVEAKFDRPTISSVIYSMIHNNVIGLPAYHRCKEVFNCDTLAKTIKVDCKHDEYNVMTDCISAIPLLY